MKYEILLIVGVALVILGFVYLVGGNGNETETNNSTTVKNCAYITNTTTLEEIRDCFRS